MMGATEEVHGDMERRSADRGAFALMLKEANQKLNHVLTQNGELSAQVKALSEQVNHLSQGFPRGDADSHRRYHEELIAQIQQRGELWGKLRYELVKWGLLGFAAWAAYALWQQFLHGPKG
jgi:hypothetical protein